MNIYENITKLIGKTPLVYLNSIKEKYQLQANLIAKLESLNPGGSLKDRVALRILKSALEHKLINQNSTIIEPTSGNTGIALALVCASLGLKLVIVMPDSMSLERRSLLKAYGAKLVLTQGALGMVGAIDKAKELLANTENAFMPSQFDNLQNVNSHYLTTAKELYQDTDGKIDVFLAGVGTGGTISGVGKFLKERNQNIEVIAIEPTGAPILTRGLTGPHKIQGIGAGFIPKILNQESFDRVIDVTDADAIEATQKLALYEGILAGIATGAVLHVAMKLASKKEYAGKNITFLVSDTGERYLSTQAFL
ncbi:MAG: cysteine synthase A [Succinivibrio sp.]|nr:cysteine synthase A [Succinivibrio sp.]MDD7287043.1 cysteine synthase A [Succinivibrio sp.]MDY5904529.1 cysteine synthase A [Succinivibrio sp.]